MKSKDLRTAGSHHQVVELERKIQAMITGRTTGTRLLQANESDDESIQMSTISLPHTHPITPYPSQILDACTSLPPRIQRGVNSSSKGHSSIHRRSWSTTARRQCVDPRTLPIDLTFMPSLRRMKRELQVARTIQHTSETQEP